VTHKYPNGTVLIPIVDYNGVNDDGNICKGKPMTVMHSSLERGTYYFKGCADVGWVPYFIEDPERFRPAANYDAYNKKIKNGIKLIQRPLQKLRLKR